MGYVVLGPVIHADGGHEVVGRYVETHGRGSHGEAMRDHKDAAVREAAWKSVRDAWRSHSETCAAALDAITGWCLELTRKRGLPSFLSSSLLLNHMYEAALKALPSAIKDGSHIGRKALHVQARAPGKDALAIWDLFAPAPVSAHSKLYTYEEGL